MIPPSSPSSDPRVRLAAASFRNWVSLAGVVVAVSSLFAFLLLFVLDLTTGHSNPYLGILTYLASPAFLILGLFLMGVGWYLQRRSTRLQEAGRESFFLEIDFSRKRDRRNLVLFVAGTVSFLLLTALGSYQTYHFTESNVFCGEVCHTVMEPEYTTYQQGSHARVDCVECHIGSGAQWYVKSKISGLYQVYSVMFNKYSRPIDTPIHSLRPAQDTCEQCHWPQKLIGDLDRTYRHFLTDEANTPFTVRLSLKVGGSDESQGPVGGIHWHVNPANRVEYVAADPDHLVIPWIRWTDQNGVVRVYRAPDFTEEPPAHAVQTMDCIDCHTRPAHIYQTPNDAVEFALAHNRLDPTLPEIKKVAVDALSRSYSDQGEAFAAIQAALLERYPGDPRGAQAAGTVKEIYRLNHFPKMGARWDRYPDQIGHKDWPGCLRCHDGNHTTADGSETITADCQACHTILAQGQGPQLRQLAPEGLEFDHPGGDVSGFLCHECHNGANME